MLGDALSQEGPNRDPVRTRDHHACGLERGNKGFPVLVHFGEQPASQGCTPGSPQP